MFHLCRSKRKRHCNTVNCCLFSFPALTTFLFWNTLAAVCYLHCLAYCFQCQNQTHWKASYNKEKQILFIMKLAPQFYHISFNKHFSVNNVNFIKQTGHWIRDPKIHFWRTEAARSPDRTATHKTYYTVAITSHFIIITWGYCLLDKTARPLDREISRTQTFSTL